MGNTVEQWRRTVGCRRGGARQGGSPSGRGDVRSLQLVALLVAVLAALLVIGGVEVNPGPDHTQCTGEDDPAVMAKNEQLEAMVKNLQQEIVRLRQSQQGTTPPVFVADESDKIAPADAPKKVLEEDKWSSAETSVQTYKKLASSADDDGTSFEIKMLSLLFMRGLNHTQQFFMASNMAAAGRYDDIVYRYKLPGHEWRTAFIQLKHKKTRKVNRSALLDTTGKNDFSLYKYCHSYYCMKANYPKCNDLQFCGKFESFDFIVYTNADVEPELVNRNRKSPDPRSVELLSTGEDGLAFTFDEDVDGDVFQAVHEAVHFKALLDEVKDKDEEEIVASLNKCLGGFSKANASLLSKSKELIEKPFSDDIAKVSNEIKLEACGTNIDSVMFDMFLRNLTCFCTQANQENLDDYIQKEIQKHLEINDTIALAKLSKELQTEIHDWWMNGECFLDKNASFWEKIILLKVKEYSDKLWHKMNFCSVTFKRDIGSSLKESLHENGILYIWAEENGSVMMTAKKLNQIVTELRNHERVIFVGLGDFIGGRKTEILRTWQSRYCQSLVLVCEPEVTRDDVASVCSELHAVLQEYRPPLRAVVVSKTSLALAAIQSCHEHDIVFRVFRDKTFYTDLTDETQEALMSRHVLFQGTEMPLRALVAGEFEKDVMSHVNGETLAQLVSGEPKIHLGSLVDKQIDYYIPRKLERANMAIDITCVTDVTDRVVLITAEPGMGKSTLMTHLALSTKRDNIPVKWVIRVNLTDTTTYLGGLELDSITLETAIEFIIRFSSGNGGNLEERLLKTSLKYSGHVLLLMDGVDEVCPYYEDKVCQLLRSLLDTKIEQIWVTSRVALKENLQNVLACSAYSLVPFTKCDQENCLQAYWNSKSLLVRHGELNVSKFVNQVLEMTEGTFTNDRLFMKIPQLTVLLAEYFENPLKIFINTGEIYLPNRLDLLLLYRSIVEKKFRYYFTNKMRVNSSNSQAMTMITTQTKTLIQKHMSAAVTLLLSPEEVKTLSIDVSQVDEFLGMIKDGRENTEIIHKILGGKPVFIHRTFAEYFTAIWFTENYQECRLLLRDKLFQPDFQLVRDIFDRCLIKDLRLHTAVVDLNMIVVRALLSEMSDEGAYIAEMDTGGRSALHLAVAYSGTHIHEEYNALTEILLDHGASLDDVDEVLQWTPLEYADHTYAWGAAGLIMKRRCRQMEMKKAKKCMSPLVYKEFIAYLACDGVSHMGLMIAAARDGNMRVLRYLVGLRIDVDVADHEGNTPLLVATQEKHLDAIVYLLASGAQVDARNIYGQTALLVATKHNHFQAITTLVEHGADINASDRNGETSLLVATEQNHLETIAFLVGNGADVNARNNDGQTSLLVASKVNHIETVTFLVEKGADVNAYDNNRKTALLHSAKYYNLEIITFLLTAGAHVNAHDRKGQSPLLLVASGDKQLHVIKNLIETGADVNAFDNCGRTALLVACEQDSYETIAYLVEAGADVNHYDRNGWNSLLVASYHGMHNVDKIIACLVSRGATLKQSPLNSSIEQKNAVLLCASYLKDLELIQYQLDQGANILVKNKGGESVLSLAIMSKTLVRNCLSSCLELLVVRGADVNACDRDGVSVLMCAAYNASLDTVLYLIDSGANDKALTRDGRSVLHHMVRQVCPRTDVMGLLLARGADVNGCDKERVSVLMDAAYGGSVNAVKYLLGRGANITAVTKDGRSVLQYMVRQNDVPNREVLGLLLANRIDVNGCDENKVTTLMSAAYGGSLETVKYLIDSGASLTAVNKDGRTLLHYMVEQESPSSDVLDFLIERGVDVDACDNAGVSVLMCAAYGGSVGTVEYLIGHGANTSAVTKDGRSVLQYMVNFSSPNLDVLKVMLNRGLDVNMCTNRSVSTLMTAACGGSLEVVKFLVKSGANLESLTEDGCNVLHVVTRQGSPSLDVLRYLLDRGLDVNARDELNATVVMHAASGGSLQAVKYLVQRGANIKAVTEAGHSVLHYMVNQRYPSPDVIDYLLEQGLSINDCTYGGVSILMLAANGGSFEVVKHLVERGADVKALTKNSRSVLHFIVRKDSLTLDMLNYLSEHGLDANTGARLRLLKLAAFKGCMEAVKHATIGRSVTKYMANQHSPSLDMLSYFIDRGLDVNARTDAGHSVLMCAAQSCSTKALKYLIERGADFTAVDKNGRSAVHTILQKCYLSRELLSFLFKHDLNVDLCTNEGVSLLMCAAYGGSVEAVRFLIERGATTTATTKDGRSVLHYMLNTESFNLQVMCELVELGLDVNARTNAGVSILACAAQCGLLDAVNFLIDRGANDGAVTECGFSVLQYLLQYSKLPNLAVIDVLLARGADINACDKKGVTVLMSAAYNGSLEVVKYLIVRGADEKAFTQDGRTTLHFMLNQNSASVDVVDFLVGKGADVNATSYSQSVLSLARKHKLTEVSDLLIKHGAT